MLAFDDRWIWDFWLADDGDRHHAFYLQAPKSLGDPDRRHDHATVGHAVSRDLVTWEPLADAALGFVDHVGGEFVGALSDPVPVPFG